MTSLDDNFTFQTRDKKGFFFLTLDLILTNDKLVKTENTRILDNYNCVVLEFPGWDRLDRTEARRWGQEHIGGVRQTGICNQAPALPV